MNKAKIAIFGVLDFLTGRLVELLNRLGPYEICFFISMNELPKFIKIEDFAQINIAFDISNKVVVGRQSIIGAGSLVLENCEPQSLYYGRPATFVKRIVNHKP